MGQDLSGTVDAMRIDSSAIISRAIGKILQIKCDSIARIVRRPLDPLSQIFHRHLSPWHVHTWGFRRQTASVRPQFENFIGESGRPRNSSRGWILGVRAFLTPAPTLDQKLEFWFRASMVDRRNAANWHVISWLPIRVSFRWASLPLGFKHLFDPVFGEEFETDRIAEILHQDRRMNPKHRAEVQNCGQLWNPFPIFDSYDGRPVIAGKKGELILRKFCLKASLAEDRSGVRPVERSFFFRPRP